MENRFAFAGFPSEGDAAKPILTAILEQSEWTTEQKTGFETLMKNGDAIFSVMSAELPPPGKGLYIKGIFDPSKIDNMITKFLEDPRQVRRVSPGQLFKLRNNLLPLIKLADTLAMVGAVSDEGMHFRLRVQGTPESSKPLADLTKFSVGPKCAAFIDPDALLNVAQLHVLPPPGSIIGQIRAIPQTAVIQGYLASVGLDLEKDILPTNAQDSMVTMSLNPIGDGGIPDIRVIAKVENPAALLAMVPKLKQLAVNLGIFVAISTEAAYPTVKVSYFLFPNFGVHLSMVDGFLVLATGNEGLVKTIARIQDVTSGKIPAFKIPESVQRYWRVSFQRLNEQLQRLLQSPLLANRGIPPISNITMARELGDLVLFTRILPDHLEISVDLPLMPVESRKPQSEKENQ
ncbi:MAG: hypothetical protein WA705_11980 [Candidatus Ozemobacteraceae bacterium]